MRLWSIHPRYLDTKGLVALWREALLAQNVLADKTKGYKEHPQLLRFRKSPQPLALIGRYLYYVYLEAQNRNYKFNYDKIIINEEIIAIEVTQGQVSFEWQHLLEKVKTRDTVKYIELSQVCERNISVNPIFKIIPGKIEHREKR